MTKISFLRKFFKIILTAENSAEFCLKDEIELKLIPKILED